MSNISGQHSLESVTSFFFVAFREYYQILQQEARTVSHYPLQWYASSSDRPLFPPQRVYWELSLTTWSRDVHLYTIPICTCLFTGSIILGPRIHQRVEKR
jgi:hypothetical protein